MLLQGISLLTDEHATSPLRQSLAALLDRDAARTSSPRPVNVVASFALLGGPGSAFAVPALNLLGLFAEVVEVRHDMMLLA